MMKKPITGRTVLIITVSAFAVIMAVNFTMAYLAVGTFPGLEVKNSYVASQQFDAKRAEQEQLGWRIDHSYVPGELVLQFRGANGASVSPTDFEVLIGRTTASRDDFRPEFTGYAGRYSADIELPRGKWMMLVQATAPDGTEFLQRLELYVRG